MKEAVHDLWPLGLLRARAGNPRIEVEVARPASFEAVAQFLRSGRRVLPAGGRSGACGALAPNAEDLVLDMTALAEYTVDLKGLTVRAQAGVNGMELEQDLNRRGLTLGHFPASLTVATIGGLISTRSSGQESTRYGNVEDMLLGLTVALPDGRIVESRAQPRAAGPPLAQLFVGAEGGLGVILEAVLRVRRRPDRVIGRGWRLPSVEAGLEVMREVMQTGLRPLVLRLYDPADSAFQGLDSGCLLLGAAAGPEPVAQAEAVCLDAAARALGAEPLGAEPWERWSRHRFDLSAARLRDLLEPSGAYLDTIEITAWWPVLPALYRDIKAHLEQLGLAMCHFSHAYEQGCCAYLTFVGSAPDEPQAEAAYLEAWRGTMELTLRHRAGIAHHHGVGQARAPWIRAGMGDWWQVWELVATALDPDRRMNPHALGGLVQP